MIIKVTGRCHYCGKAMTYNHPWHSECWLAAQEQKNPQLRKTTEPACWIKDCKRPAHMYSKILGYWERVCSEHTDEGYSLDRSMQHVSELLAGREA